MAHSTIDLESLNKGHIANDKPAPNPTTPIERSTTKDSCVYHAVPLWRKCVLLFVMGWTALGATFSSTSMLIAASEIANEFSTTQTTINLSTGGVLLAMSCSSFIWNPIGTIIGRRSAWIACITALFLFTMGAALSPNTQTFVAMRLLSGLQGTYFHVAGQTMLAEYFPPTQRGTATGFFLVSTVLGPPLGPCIAGIVVTFASWRLILWLQCALVGIALILSLICIPRSELHGGISISGNSICKTVALFNPIPVFRLIGYPNILLADLSCGLLSWTQYSLLAGPRHIISTRFHLASPLLSGLFYIAPAGGFLLGTVVGGRYSDMTVINWITKRAGTRLPQDRLNSSMLAFFLIIPAASLGYGWGLECESCSRSSGGLALPITTSFFVAFGLLASFASLNTYCAEVMPKKRKESVAAKYLVQYVFGAAACSGTVPLIDSVGVGLTSTIGTICVILAGILTFLTAKYGLHMQTWRDNKSQEGSNNY